MVTPLAFMAATPVGATITIFLVLVSFIFLNKVVFPVPAFPVRKIFWLVVSIKERTLSKMSFVEPVVVILQI